MPASKVCRQRRRTIVSRLPRLEFVRGGWLSRRPAVCPVPRSQLMTVPRSAARTSAGLAPLTPPPRMDLFASGDSGLARLAPSLPSADHVVLAQVAEAVAGKEWWWWGSWEAGGHLYWSLVGHNGTAEAGAIPIASLEPFLTRLVRALPTLLDGETAPANVARAVSGALAEPDATVALANKLGKLLISPASQRSGAGASRKRSTIIAGGGTSPVTRPGAVRATRTGDRRCAPSASGGRPAWRLGRSAGTDPPQGARPILRTGAWRDRLLRQKRGPTLRRKRPP
jgi:hypothetical protein